LSDETPIDDAPTAVVLRGGDAVASVDPTPDGVTFIFAAGGAVAGGTLDRASARALGHMLLAAAGDGFHRTAVQRRNDRESGGI
jgi:hypothetical protein